MICRSQMRSPARECDRSSVGEVCGSRPGRSRGDGYLLDGSVGDGGLDARWWGLVVGVGGLVKVTRGER